MTVPVSSNAKLKEQIELDNLALQARLDEERNKSQLLEDGDRYVILIVKNPLMAMRYRLPDGQIRRIQLNFKPEAGYDIALSQLQNLGVPIRDKDQPAPHPTSAGPRPSQLSQHALPPPQPSGLLPSPEFTCRPNTSNGSEHMPSSSAPERPPDRPWTAPEPVSFSQTLPPKRELPRSMQLYTDTSSGLARRPVSSAPQMLSSGQVSHSQMLPPSRQMAPKVQPPTNTSYGFKHDLTKTSSHLPSSDLLNSSQTSPPGRELPLDMQNHTRTSQMTTQVAANSPKDYWPNLPKQTLPVAKPPAKRMSRAKAANPKASKRKAAANVKELQLVKNGTINAESETTSRVLLQGVPDFVEAPEKAKATARRARPQAPSSIVDRNLQTSRSETGTKDAAQEQLAARASTLLVRPDVEDASDATTTESLEANPTLTTVATEKSILSSKPGRPLDIRHGRQAMIEIAGNDKDPNEDTSSLSTTKKDDEPKRTSLAGNGEVSAEEFMSQLNRFVLDYHDLPAPKPRPTVTEELAAYAAQPDEVRQAVIKDMICDFLGDENFIKLTEDMSKEWTRLGLGF